MDKLLSILIFLPLVVAAGLLFLPNRMRQMIKTISLLTAMLDFGIAICLLKDFKAEAGMQFSESQPWIPFLGIDYQLGLDGFSLFIVFLTTLFIPVSMIWAWNSIKEKEKLFFILLLILESGLLGTLLALDLFLFYIFWELMLIPMFFLIGMWGGKNCRKAVTKFVIYTMAGSLALLLGILYIGYLSKIQTGFVNFNILDMYSLTISEANRPWLFATFLIAFLIKAPLFPFHSWLPDTYTEAPSVVTFLLSGIMAKMGVYGLIRIAIPMFPDMTIRWAPILMGLAVIGVIYGALIALAQQDIKRLIAFASISHMSLIVLGIFSWNLTSLEGSVYHIINHAISTGALFLLIGHLEEHYGTRQINELGGLAQIAPIYAFYLIMMTLSSIGLPGLNGFIGEFLILLGVFSKLPIASIFAAATLILGAAYMLWMIQRLLFGQLIAKPIQLEFSFVRGMILLPFLILAIVLGLNTQIIFSRINPTIKHYINEQNSTVQVWTPVRAVNHHE